MAQIRESFTLTEEQWENIWRITKETDSRATAGPKAGELSYRALWRRIADGELLVVEPDEDKQE